MNAEEEQQGSPSQQQISPKEQKVSALAGSTKNDDDSGHELAAGCEKMEKTSQHGEEPPTPPGHSGQCGSDDGVRRGGGDPGKDSGDRPESRDTRFLDTTLGILSYAQLAPHLAERVARVNLAIVEGEFENWPIEEDLLLEIHRRLCADLVPDWAGRWRRVEVRVGNLQPPPPHRVAVCMRDYCADLRARWTDAREALGDLTLEFLGFAEGRFLTIHPFADFNGRTIRLFLTELLRRLDLPTVALEAETSEGRRNYFAALEAADRNQWQPLVDIWRERLSHADLPET